MENLARQHGETAEEMLYEVKCELQAKQMDVTELRRQLGDVIQQLSQADLEHRRLQAVGKEKEKLKSLKGVSFSEEAEESATAKSKPPLLPSKPKASRNVPIVAVFNIRGSVAKSVPRLSRWKDSFLRWLGARRTTKRAVVPTSKAAKKIHREAKKKKRGAEKRSSFGKRATPVKKMPKKPVKVEENAEVKKQNQPSIWKKRRGTKAKARPTKRQRVEDNDSEPLPSRPAVTLLPRVHQGFEAPMDDEVRPSDSIGQVGEGLQPRSSVHRYGIRQVRDHLRGPREEERRCEERGS